MRSILVGTAVWLGRGVWLGIAIAHATGRLHLGAIEVFFLLGPLVVVPLGLELAGRLLEPGPRRALLAAARVLAPPAGWLAAASFWAPDRRVSALLCAPWMAAAGLAGLQGIIELARGVRLARRFGWVRAIPRLLAAVALGYLPAGAFGLLASRARLTPLGFEEPLVILFAVHFHFAAFVSPLLAGAVAAELGRLGKWPRAARAVAAGAAAGPGLIALGFILDSAALRLVGVVVFTASLTGLALLHLPVLRALPGVAARALLGLSAAAVIPAMTLAAVYGAGDFAGRIWISIPTMAVTHGALNGLGFAVLGLAGWLAVRPVEKPAT